MQAVAESTERVHRLTQSIEQELEHWRWQPLVAALQACRGIQLIHGARIVAELGDLSRFTHPRQLMAYLGMIPSEDSSGERRHQGAITKAGNSSARRALVEAAHAYQYRAGRDPGDRPAPKPDCPRRSSTSPGRRSCGCARAFAAQRPGLNRNKIVVAVARELAGFVWAIAQQVKPQ